MPTLLRSANEMTSKDLGFLALDVRLAGYCVSEDNDVKCTVARPPPSMIPISAACFQRVPWIVGGRYRYLGTWLVT